MTQYQHNSVARWNVLVAVGIYGIFFAVTAGCREESGPGTVEATGLVTFQSEPVADANVIFLPTEANASLRGSQAVTDESGRFELSTYTGEVGKFKLGAMPGEYRVTINKLDVSGPNTTGRPPENQLPAKYDNASSSGLTATVTAEGENAFNFDLD